MKNFGGGGGLGEGIPWKLVRALGVLKILYE